MTCEFDRIEELLNQSDVTGIDYVYVAENQTTLHVHFQFIEVLDQFLYFPGTELGEVKIDPLVPECLLDLTPGVLGDKGDPFQSRPDQV